MKPSTIFKSMSIAVLAVGLSACDNRPGEGAGERSGERMDQGTGTTERPGEQTAPRPGEQTTPTPGEQTTPTPGEPTTGTSASGGVADTGITTKVKAAILAEPGLKTRQISVDTVGGVVTLTGTVDTKAQSDRAAALAAEVEGVTRVDNRLSVGAERK